MREVGGRGGEIEIEGLIDFLSSGHNEARSQELFQACMWVAGGHALGPSSVALPRPLEGS